MHVYKQVAFACTNKHSLTHTHTHSLTHSLTRPSIDDTSSATYTQCKYGILIYKCINIFDRPGNLRIYTDFAREFNFDVHPKYGWHPETA